ncbi:MAG: flagellar hook-basal body protein [Desulfobacteraceae bacterium]|nr:flagellar hook-basal body protein [Desulfobacteraceae bacterium]
MILEMTRPVQGGLRQERKLEAVSNHIANADTVGFKKDIISFDKEFRAQMNTDLTQGHIEKTGNKLDLALKDEGFFKVDTAAGIRYTRNGSFTLDNNGVLVDQTGNFVLGQGGAIVVDGTNIEINETGEIRIDGTLQDRLDIITFENLTMLQKDGANNYVYKGDTRDETAPLNIAIEQRAVEGSNVKVVDEMVSMIDHHRMYQIYQKMMMTFDEIDGKAINDVGQLQ